MVAKASDLLSAIIREPALAAKLRALAAGAAEVAFGHVVEHAQPTLCAVLARETAQRVWFVCPTLATQERVHNELAQWFPDAFFFPELEFAAVEGAIADPEATADRLAIIQRLAQPDGKGRAPIIVLTRTALEDLVVDEAELQRLQHTVKRGTKVNRDDLLKKLAAAGYEHVPQVTARGQFAIRGGIVDVFSFQHSLPVRLEWFDDELESLRHFDLDAQTSVEPLNSCTLLLGEAESLNKRMRDYIRAGDLTVSVEVIWDEARARISEGLAALEASPLIAESGILTDAELATEPPTPLPVEEIPTEPATEPAKPVARGRSRKKKPAAEMPDPDVAGPARAALAHRADLLLHGAGEDFSTAFYDHGLGEFDAGDFVVDEIKRERFFGQLREWREQGWQTFVFCNNEGETERLHDLLPPVEADALHFVIGALGRGFTFPAGKIAALSDSELFGRYRNTRARRMALQRSREAGQRAHIDYSELIEGELVVHLEHGIGRFLELKQLPNGEDVLVLEFADGARLYVPLEQSFLVARYVGIGKRNPALSKLGDAAWTNAKKKAEKAVFDYAGKLLELHAQREIQQGYAFPPDNKWMQEFESSFIYKETTDQLRAIADTKADMESERPMDRLICGDVGFGKTEVAIRAAFKAVCAGKQVALLVPTTVLAEQHYRTFRERVSDYPMQVGMLSRFRTRAEQNETVRGAAAGSVDIVIGTHRLISKDVSFKNLGLVVIDEEQRFGVLHKEKFKELWPLVDMLTLSATPIPRTLYMSLMGAKDMSTIETAPANRLPVETLICPYDERIIRDAINRELKRQGQVYFLHNRVGDIETVALRIKKLCPQARVIVGHGQMAEHELEEVMHKFVAGEVDVLIATTIIESGVDIPNANTILIDRADRFGLADLYQLRGRVGRAQHKAYAYLLLPRDMMSAGEARKRINAIKQYGSLGAGFKIAMRDLEIRGAGSILGTQQSGHIVSIGFDLYCALLRQAIAKLKGQKGRSRLPVALRLDFVIQREAEFLGKTAAEQADPFLQAKAARELAQSAADKRPKPTGTSRGYSIPHRPPAPAPEPAAPLTAFAPAYIPATYLTETAPRIAAYRRLAELTTQEQLDALRKEWRDRYGRLPQAAENLLLLTELSLAAAARKITAIEVKDGTKLMLTRNADYILLGGKFPRLTAPDPTARLDELLKMVRSF
jgi:transcription-repair coupling factor (superfamily II helicase)